MTSVFTSRGRSRWLPAGSLARRSRGPLLGGLWLRVLTRWRARDLDRRLAAGADPMESDELSLRVGQLGSIRTRRSLANALRGAVELASGRYRPLIGTRLRLLEIAENQDLLLELAGRLDGGEPLGIEGLAMTSRLVSDGSSPLRRSGPAGSLPTAVMRALAALERGQRTAAA